LEEQEMFLQFQLHKEALKALLAETLMVAPLTMDQAAVAVPQRSETMVHLILTKEETLVVAPEALEDR
jgi:hypothetical protein